MSTKCKFMYGMVTNNFLLAAFCLELNPFSPVGNFLSMDKNCFIFFIHMFVIYLLEQNRPTSLNTTADTMSRVRDQYQIQELR